MRYWNSLISISLLAIVCAFLSPAASAHYGGKPVFKINGVFTKVNNLSQAPQDEEIDLSPNTYSSNQPLHFEFDYTKLPSPKSILDKSTIIWDFGDGTPQQPRQGGFTNDHVYKKAGDYTLKLYADYKPAGFNYPPQTLETVKITVLEESSQKEKGNNKFIPLLIILFLLLIPALIIGFRKKI